MAEAANIRLVMGVVSGVHLGRNWQSQSLRKKQTWGHSNPLILTSASQDDQSIQRGLRMFDPTLDLEIP